MTFAAAVEMWLVVAFIFSNMTHADERVIAGFAVAAMLAGVVLSLLVLT